MSNNLAGLSFSLMSPEDITAQSNLKVLKSQLYNTEGLPLEEGLLSPLLGGGLERKNCPVCGSRGSICQGHEGHIELVMPVMHPCTRTTLANLLNLYCQNCNKINTMVNWKKTVKKSCQFCKKDLMHCVIPKNKPYLVMDVSNKGSLSYLNPGKIFQILEKITPEIVFKGLGFRFDPRSLMIKNLMVPSMSIRPNTTIGGSNYTEDMTIKLQTILEVSNKLEKIKDISLMEETKNSLYELLAYHVYTYLDSKIPELPIAVHRGGKPIKSVLERLESKTGYFRQHLGAKRTNYSGRAVITPGFKIGLDEVGISINYAKKMTIPELITSKNVEKYRKNILNAVSYPEVQIRETRVEGRVIKTKILPINREQVAANLKPGDIVHRSLVSGDPCIMNRQPTLHQYGMMAHKIVVLKDSDNLEGESFRIHNQICSPYHADFDGDEMNKYTPTTLAACREAKLLMSVRNSIQDNKNNRPIIGVQAELLNAAYQMTRFPKDLSRVEVIELVGDLALGVEGGMNTREIFSLLFPKDYSFSEPEKTVNRIVIKDGVLVSGYFTKSKISKASALSKDLISTIGGTNYFFFLENLFNLLKNYYRKLNFTLTLSDYEENIFNGRENMYKEILELVEKGSSPVVAARKVQLKGLNDLLAKIKPENRVAILALSGASGSIFHLAQMTNLGGVKTVRGSNPSSYFKGCYPKFAGLENGKFYQNGLVLGNYSQGLSHEDLISDCMVARDALIESNIKIRDIGYYGRKVSYSFSDIIVNRSSQIVDSKGNIVQYLYSGHGYNSWIYNTNSINQKFKEYVSSKESGNLDREGVKSYLELLGYDAKVVKTAVNHLSPNQTLSQKSALEIAQMLLMPASAPVGLGCAQALHERSGQLTLDAKHNQSSDQQGMKRLFALLDKLLVKPSATLTGPLEILKSFEEEHRLKTVQDKLEYTIDLELGKIKLETSLETLELIVSELRDMGINFLVDKEQFTISIPRDGLNFNTNLSYLLQSIKNIQVGGTRYVESWDFKSEGQTHKLKVRGGTVGPALYRWLVKTAPKELKITFHDPSYAEKVGGIELARKVLYEELMALKESGLDIDSSYISLIADTLTRTGVLTSTSRSGVLREKPGLIRCAFESTKRVIFELALTQKVDNLVSPLSSVICGSPLKIGTGYFKVNL